MTKIFSVSSDTPDPFLEVNLNKGQKIFCESDAMVYMSSNLDLTGRTNGGFMRAIFRNIAMVNHYSNKKSMPFVVMGMLYLPQLHKVELSYWKWMVVHNIMLLMAHF